MAYKNPSVKLPDRSSDTKKTATSSKSTPIAEYRELTPAYFMFIDVLGFKDTFESSEKQVKKVFEYFALLSALNSLSSTPTIDQGAVPSP